jgi:hypothetical protein
MTDQNCAPGLIQPLQHQIPQHRIFTMPEINVLCLPTEIHLEIGSNLTDHDFTNYAVALGSDFKLVPTQKCKESILFITEHECRERLDTYPFTLPFYGCMKIRSWKNFTDFWKAEAEFKLAGYRCLERRCIFCDRGAWMFARKVCAVRKQRIREQNEAWSNGGSEP